MKPTKPYLLYSLAGCALTLSTATAAPKVLLISLDGATPRLVDQYLATGALPTNSGLGLLQAKGVRATINQTVSPSLTAVGHIAIATGSSAARNNVIANSFHLVASPFNLNISGFGAPIGGYCTDCNAGGPGPANPPSADPLWVHLRHAGKKVITATWPGGDGVDVRVPGAANNAIVHALARRTVDFTIPFGAFAGAGAQGFSLVAADFTPAPAETAAQLAAAGRVSFSSILQKTTALERLVVGGVTNFINVAALDTTDDTQANYDTLVFFDSMRGIEAGPFALPATGPAYVKASEKTSRPYYVEGSQNRAGCNYYVSRLEPDLSVVRISRTSANSIPRNPAVLGQVDDVHANVGFWAPQPDFRIPERISPGYGPFPDLELEEIYADLVRGFTDYQTRLALHAMRRLPDADLVMVYFEQPDGSTHQFLLTDPRQASDFLNPASIGAGQDAAKVARYASYLKVAYQAANAAVQRLIEEVGVDSEGRPQSNVIVTSDHGFEAFHTAVNMNSLLLSNNIPSAKVRAITSGPAVNIYIALQGREPNGTVSREEYVALQTQVANLLRSFTDSNPTYTLGEPNVPVFDRIYTRPVTTDLADPKFGLGTSEFIGQDSGDIYALLKPGYNFDGIQSPVVGRQADEPQVSQFLSVPNFYGAHGYDPTHTNMSAILFAAGPEIGQGVVPLSRNIDVAPTIGRILGVELPGVEGVPLPIGHPKLLGTVVQEGGGGYRIQFKALSGQNYVLEASADLNGWTPILTNKVGGDLFEHLDATKLPWRFYRAQFRR